MRDAAIKQEIKEACSKIDNKSNRRYFQNRELISNLSWRVRAFQDMFFRGLPTTLIFLFWVVFWPSRAKKKVMDRYCWLKDESIRKAQERIEQMRKAEDAQKEQKTPETLHEEKASSPN